MANELISAISDSRSCAARAGLSRDDFLRVRPSASTAAEYTDALLRNARQEIESNREAYRQLVEQFIARGQEFETAPPVAPVVENEVVSPPPPAEQPTPKPEAAIPATPRTADEAFAAVNAALASADVDAVTTTTALLLDFNRFVAGRKNVPEEYSAQFNRIVRRVQDAHPRAYARAVNEVERLARAEDVNGSTVESTMENLSAGLLRTPQLRRAAFDKLVPVAGADLRGSSDEKRTVVQAVRTFLEAYTDDPGYIAAVTAFNKGFAQEQTSEQADATAGAADVDHLIKSARRALTDNDTDDFLDAVRGLLDYYYSTTGAAKKSDTVPQAQQRVLEKIRKFLQPVLATRTDAMLQEYEAQVSNARHGITSQDRFAAVQREVGGHTILGVLSAVQNRIAAAPATMAPSMTATETAMVRKIVRILRAVGPDTLETLQFNDVPIVSLLNPNMNSPTVLRFTHDGGRWQLAVWNTPEQAARGRFSLADWNDGSKAKGAKPLKPQQVRLMLGKMLRSMAIRPDVYVFKDQADMAKSADAEVYEAAKAARPEGDFDTALAAGYSFSFNGKPTVILFTNRLANETHARFVAGHELLGHFGLRAFLGNTAFDKLMTGIYDSNLRVREHVDRERAINTSKSQSEATEEYLADYAGALEVSLVARVWAGIKSALNRAGFKFGDDSVRFLLTQARRYVRTGQASSMFNASDVAARLDQAERQTENSLSRLGSLVSENERLGLLRMDVTPPPLEAIFDFLRRVSGRGTGADALLAQQKITDVSSALDYLKQNYGSMAIYRANENAGLHAFDKLLGEMRDISMRVKVEFNERLQSVLSRAVYGNWGGISRDNETKLSELLYNAREFVARRAPSPAALGTKPLFELDDMGRWVLDTAEVKRLEALGSITFEQARDGFTIEIPNPSGGPPLRKQFAGYKDLTEDSIIWQGYLKSRQALRDVELELLKAIYSNHTSDRDTMFAELGDLVRGGALTDNDQKLFLTMVRRIRETMAKGAVESAGGAIVYDDAAMTAANDMMVALNTALITDDPAKSIAELRTFLADQTVADDVEAKILDMRSRAVIAQNNRFLLQNKVKQAVLAGDALEGANKYAKRSIASGYIPIHRDGIAEVRVEARVNNRRVLLKDTFKERLVYSQFDSVGEAQTFANTINKSFRGQTFEVEALNPDTGQFDLVDVELVAVAGDALTQLSVNPELNYNEFIRGLRQFDITLSPQKMADLIVALNTQNAAARNRLQASFTPGYDTSMAVTAMSRHIESRSATIAKTYTRARLNELLNLKLGKSSRLWFGDAEAVMAKRDELDAARADPRLSPERIRVAETAFHDALYKYRTTQPGAAQWDGSRNTFSAVSVEAQPARAMRHYNNAAATMAFIDGNRFVDETDFGSGAIASGVRTYTGLVQLGGSIAQGVMNLLSLTTNWVPFMATYNTSNGFGGGYGMGRSYAELMRAMRDIGAPGMALSARGRGLNTAEFYDNMTTNPTLLKQYGLKAHEAKFIANEIREGIFIPAQFNALVGTARGTTGVKSRLGSALMQKFVDNFMLPFNTSEAAARRSAGLAAYRLAYARISASYATDEDRAANETRTQAEARAFAVRSVKLTLGEYSVLNRPPAWRDGLQSFLFMYKTYPVTTIQLFANLSRKGKLSMLATLWALSGAAGLPLVEDMEDLIDTIAQKLGFKMGSIRALIAKHIEEHFPGMSPIVFKGLVNQVLPIPADVASRMSVGDILPGTGMLLAGANVGQELKDIAGPAAGAVLSTATFVSDLIATPFSPTKTVLGAMRESPVTAMRMLGDSYAYWNSNAVVDKRGYVVSQDMGAATILTRLLGFYPEPAAAQYELIRLSNRLTGYQREMATTFRIAWVKAMMTGDTAGAREVVDLVNDWNAGSKGTALEIRNFVASANRALREARLEAGARARRAAPISAREDIDRLIDAFTAE